MIFAKIGDGPCYYHYNEICDGVFRDLLISFDMLYFVIRFEIGLKNC
jgi:hypothetical protein